jgi:hypothetical protein
MHTCCGEPLRLMALSVRGVQVASTGTVEWNRGIRFAVYTCAHCASESFEGWIPPTWVGAIARACGQIRAELAAEGYRSPN